MVTSGGDLLIAGISDSFGEEYGDAGLLQIDPMGNVVRQAAIGASGDDMATDARETTDGGIVFAGWTESFGAQMADLWLVKLDAGGDVLWQQTFGGAGHAVAGPPAPSRARPRRHYAGG